MMKRPDNLQENTLLVKAAAKIHSMGPKYVVIKKGEHGALIFSGSHVFFALLFLLKKFLIQLVQEIHLLEGLQDF